MIFIPYGTRESTRKQRFPIITALLVLVNIAVFALELSILANYGEAALAAFIGSYAVIPANVTDGSPFEPGLISSMFLHGGLLHIIGNLLFLLPFGDYVEDRLGHGRYLLFYLLCGLAGSLAHVVFDPASSVPTLGASGAIAGVLAGYLALHPLGQVRGLLFIVILLIRVELPAIIFIGYWFVMQLFSGVAALGGSPEAGGIAFMAHVGGFVAGLVLAPLLLIGTKKPIGYSHNP